MSEDILLHSRDARGVHTITLNNPQAFNALSEAMMAAFKQAVEKQLRYFEEELQVDLARLAAHNKTGLYDPALTAKAITRLVFAIGATAMDLPKEKRAEVTEQLTIMVRMIVVGTQTMATSGTVRM